MPLQRLSSKFRKGITTSKKSIEALRQTIGGVSMMQEIVNAFHKMGFWFLIFFMIGCILGGYAIHKYQNYQMNEAVMIGGLVFDSKVFDLKRRL